MTTARYSSYHEAVKAHFAKPDYNGKTHDDLMNFDISLASFIGEQLELFLALDEHIKDYSFSHSTFHADLRVHAVALRYYEASTVSKHLDEELEAVAGVRLALQFLADNFDKLWV